MKIALAAALVALAASTSAVAQQQPQPVTPSSHGAAINGMCVFDMREAMANSAAGRSIGQQLAAYIQQADAEFSMSTLDEELNAYAGQSVENLPEALRNRAIGARNRMAQIQATEQQQIALLAQYVDGGALAAAYAERRCSILLENMQYIYANPAMDITAAVTSRLDAAVPTWPQIQLLQPRQQ